MMAFQNRQMLAQYNQSKVLTASPAELTLMLYDGAIKFCNIAMLSLEKNDIEQAHVNIKKTQRIIEEFQATLNTKYAVAKDFSNIYEYVSRRLVMANVSKDQEILKEVLTHLHTLRDTWKEVMRINRESKGRVV